MVPFVTAVECSFVYSIPYDVLLNFQGFCVWNAVE